ncbi:hypothetical protein GCM10009771_10550 [Nesterenkonia flava]
MAKLLVEFLGRSAEAEAVAVEAEGEDIDAHNLDVLREMLNDTVPVGGVLRETLKEIERGAHGSTVTKHTRHPQ